MSRHRDIRNIELDDHELHHDDDDDYGSSYSGSYYDETTLSTSVEKEFMYRRNQSGTTPKMSHFLNSSRIPSVPEEDDAASAPASAVDQFDEFDYDDNDEEEFSKKRLGRQNSLTIGQDLNEEDRDKLAAALEKILDIVGLDSIPESIIKEAIIKCDYDHHLALNTILNNPPTIYTEAKKKNRSSSRYVDATPPLPVLPPSRCNDTTTSTTTPSPLPPVIVSIQENASKKPLPSLEPLSFEQNSRSPSNSRTPSGRNSPIVTTTTTPSTTPFKVTMRKNKVNALEEYNKIKGQDGKNLLNLVVIGHVDSGKSTLMGHLLVNLGNVSSRSMHKYEQESRKLGKQSFCYAWVLDETSEERNRGITMDVGQSKFVTKTKIVTLLDAPGHKDFIPNMISGAYQADVAILVVNATRGEFEAGFDAGGQTREHGLLVRSLGVGQLIVAVNKLDTVDWKEERFTEIKKKLDAFLKQIGFKNEDVTYVPCSGYTGDNLTTPATDKLKTWNFRAGTLLEAIDNFRSPVRLVEKPFRMSVSDVFKPEQTAGFSISGRIESGFVQKEDKVLICPINEIGIVKSILIDDSPITGIGFGGDVINLTMSGVDQSSISPGMVLCDPQYPIPSTKRFRARIVVFNIEIPITKGFPVVLHYGCVQVQATVKKLIATINKSNGEIIKSKPRCLVKNCNASVEISLESPICLELYSNIKELGRFMLRNNGKTLAAGLVTEIL